MKYSEEIQKQILELKEEGLSGRAIAYQLGLSKSGVNKFLEKQVVGKPKILYLDIETAPSVAAVFGRFNLNLTPSHILQEGGWLLSAAWMWEGDSTVYSITLNPVQAAFANDTVILETLKIVLNECDVVIMHNGDRFDLPTIKARMIVKGVRGLKAVKTIDTLKIARRLKFESNKLDSLGNVLGVGRKVSHEGIGLWIKCCDGDAAALKKMATYNKQDVRLLRNVYLKLRQFDTSAFNFGMLYNDGKHHCPSCGSTALKKTGRTFVTAVNEFEELECKKCGQVSRKRTGTTSKDKRKLQLQKV